MSRQSQGRARLRPCRITSSIAAALVLGHAGAARGAAARAADGLIVRFRATVAPARRDLLVNTCGCRIVRLDADSGYALVQVRDGRVADLIGLLARQPELLVAEPNYRLFVSDQSYYDPYEWYLFDRGTRSAQATSSFGIQAASAWKHTQGAGVTVAILDSGAAYENYQRFSQAPALAHTRFAPGIDIVNGTDHPDDDNGHGTLVTGVLASQPIDGGGVIGVAPAVTVLTVKVVGADGSATAFNTAAGIRWAADNGAQVINLSLGSPQTGQDLADAVNYAAAKDCVLVAASGNESSPQVDYPAGYSRCLAVGATGFDGLLAPYSNTGRSQALVAPGGNLNQDLNGDGVPDGLVAQTFDPRRGFNRFGYTFAAGTSFAAPLAAGAAALTRAANPALSADDVRTLLETTALHLGSPGRNRQYGYGLVDAAAAVAQAMMR